ncbi:hypothetical protein NSTC745_02994 [Nostoc sp. DSM 114161]|jgi:hypothetical protein
MTVKIQFWILDFAKNLERRLPAFPGGVAAGI